MIRAEAWPPRVVRPGFPSGALKTYSSSEQEQDGFSQVEVLFPSWCQRQTG